MVDDMTCPQDNKKRDKKEKKALRPTDSTNMATQKCLKSRRFGQDKKHKGWLLEGSRWFKACLVET